MNGDTFCDFDLRVLLDAHAARRAEDAACLGTLALAPAADPSAFGRVALDEEGKILAFTEKSAPEGRRRLAGGTTPGLLVSAGVYVLEREVLSRIPAGRPVSLEREVFPEIVAVSSGKSATGSLYGLPVAGSFIDIGTPEGYRRFECYVKETAV
jgi:NDP-sugar pyrophosphorylase family protein